MQIEKLASEYGIAIPDAAVGLDKFLSRLESVVESRQNDLESLRDSIAHSKEEIQGRMSSLQVEQGAVTASAKSLRTRERSLLRKHTKLRDASYDETGLCSAQQQLLEREHAITELASELDEIKANVLELQSQKKDVLSSVKSIGVDMDRMTEMVQVH